MPRPFAGTNASTVREKSAPANFSFSVFVPCTVQAGKGVTFHSDSLCVLPQLHWGLYSLLPTTGNRLHVR